MVPLLHTYVLSKYCISFLKRFTLASIPFYVPKAFTAIFRNMCTLLESTVNMKYMIICIFFTAISHN